MDYREIPPPPTLAGLVKCFWTLAGVGASGEWLEQQATPDGCVELIRRLSGRSRWDGDQPEFFAVGLIEAPARFAISADSRFAGVRLWPWTWSLLGDVPLDALRGCWAPTGCAIVSALPDFDRAGRLIEAAAPAAATGRAILAAARVGDMAATGMRPRTLQRWFARHVGLAPRRYLRLLRFQKAFEGVGDGGSLADHAAARGFADQAHMAREFRTLAGVPAVRARRSARGPFLT